MKSLLDPEMPLALPKRGTTKHLGLPMSQVRVITPRVGGGFGRKTEATVQPIAAALGLKTKKPVKVVLSREDDFAMMRSRHPARIWMRTGGQG
jgi:CO/xanthine dehydrogenase Mo-binding subunit